MIGDKAGKLHAKHAFSCHLSDSLESVVHKMNGSHVHRLYVVDDHNKPIGVVSMRDVIARLVKEPSNSQLWKYFAAEE
jgi:CBS domain-containing protein